jgi:hypothetical protein
MMKARVSQLHKSEAAWNLLPSFVPMQGEFIIFDADEKYPYQRLKIGDGKTALKELPFFIDSTISVHLAKHRTNEMIDAGRITEYAK